MAISLQTCIGFDLLPVENAKTLTKFPFDDMENDLRVKSAIKNEMRILLFQKSRAIDWNLEDKSSNERTIMPFSAR